jgi:flagellar biosynthesis protein
VTVSPQETGGSKRRAAALRYRPEKDSAPRLTAKGSGTVAEKIIALARQQGIPVQEDPALLQVLAGLDLNQEIPPSVYLVVAEILAFVYRLSGKEPSPSGRPR